VRKYVYFANVTIKYYCCLQQYVYVKYVLKKFADTPSKSGDIHVHTVQSNGIQLIQGSLYTVSYRILSFDIRPVVYKHHVLNRSA